MQELGIFEAYHLLITDYLYTRRNARPKREITGADGFVFMAGCGIARRATDDLSM